MDYYYCFWNYAVLYICCKQISMLNIVMAEMHARIMVRICLHVTGA